MNTNMPLDTTKGQISRNRRQPAQTANEPHGLLDHVISAAKHSRVPIGADLTTSALWARERQVKTGINANVGPEVLEGLNEGEQVILAIAAGSTGATTATARARNPVMAGGPPDLGRP